MNLDLPEKKFKSPYAEIVKGELLLYEVYRFEDLMYELTYASKERRCIYCGKRLKRLERTLDHRFPRNTGGISITNNLFPTCCDCNSAKDNFTHDEFIEFQGINKEHRKHFRKEVEKMHKKRVRKHGFILPTEWVISMSTEKIVYSCPKKVMRGQKYEKVREFYVKNKKMPRPVIVDRELKLLDGFNIMLVAEDNGVKNIPVIRLDNVMLMK